MKILAIECTHGFASVAVSCGDRRVEHRLFDWQKTAEALVPLVMQAMDEAGLHPSGLDGVAVSAGPGSFTALRIGMSVAKGIAFGVGCPLVSVPVMPVMAKGAMNQTGATCVVPVIPSRPGEYFYSIHEMRAGIPVEIENSRCQVAALAARILSLGRDCVVAVRSLDALASQAPGLVSCLVEASFFSAASLIPDAEAALAAGATGSAASVAPDYRQSFETGKALHE